MHKLIIFQIFAAVVLIASSCDGQQQQQFCQNHVNREFKERDYANFLLNRNFNNFFEQIPACLLPKAIGNCFGNTRRWFHDADGICKEFTYSDQCGGGNANNFQTQELCNFYCRYGNYKWAEFHDKIFGQNHFNRNEGTVRITSNFGRQPSQNNDGVIRFTSNFGGRPS